MTNNYIQFKKRRELGEILSDTFAFVRGNFKDLFTVLIRTSLIPFILVILASVYYQYVIGNISEITPYSAVFSLGGLGLAGLLFYATSSATVYSFIKEYDSTKGKLLNLEYVVSEAKSNIGNMIGLTLLAYLMLIFGLIFFVIPGIYFLVPLTVVFPILLFKETTIFGALGESFKLIKGFWWVTFGTVIVIAIIIGVMSFAFSVPALIYNVTKMVITSSNEGTLTSGNPGDFIYLTLSALGSAGSNLLSIVFLVAIGFVYYDLDEEQNRTGLKQKIEELDI